MYAATLHVNSARSRDSGDGGAYRTFAYAVKQLKPGGTLLIADGGVSRIHRSQQAQLKTAQHSSPTVVEAKPGGKVLIKSSDMVPTGKRLVVVCS